METRTERFKRRKKRSKLRRSFTFMFVLLLLLVVGFSASYDARLWLAGSLLTTQHPQWAKYTFVGDEALKKLKAEIDNPHYENSVPAFSLINFGDKKKKQLVEVIPVEKSMSVTHYYKGHVMKVSDPDRVHLVQTIGLKNRKGFPRGEWLEEFSKRTHAIGGVNASGFHDPNYMGLAPKALGLVIVDGKIIQDYEPKSGDTALGITFDGELITGKYTAKELVKMGIRDAVSFRPQLIVNGKNLFKDKEATSWGIAPRTAVGQTKDGTIIFAVIDGRHPGHSLGASMTDMANLMEEFGCINAMAMDGGTSAMMIHNGEILTRSTNGDPRGRYIPNAWMVY